MLNHLTIAFPYYESPQMLEFHKKHCFGGYSVAWHSRFEVIIVDDASPTSPISSSWNPFDIPCRVFRIEKNVPWNYAAAKNIALHEAKDGWVLLTDIDHVLTPENMEKLLDMDLDSGSIYFPNREIIDSRGRVTQAKRHIDSFLITREMFWQIGGYDERLSGFWNGAPLPFRKHSKRMAKWKDLKDVTLMRRDDRDGSVQFGRTGTEYDINNNVGMRKYQRRMIENYKPVTLSYDYFQIK